MAPKRRAMKDALCALDDDSSDESDRTDGEESGDNKAEVPQKKIRLDALQRAGYSSGPSLLHIPKQPDVQEDAWDWGSGKDQSVVAHSPTVQVGFCSRLCYCFVAQTLPCNSCCSLQEGSHLQAQQPQRLACDFQ